MLAIVNNTALGVDTTQIDPFVVSATVPPDVVVGVTLNYKFQAAAPLIGALLGDVRFTASSSMLAR